MEEDLHDHQDVSNFVIKYNIQVVYTGEEFSLNFLSNMLVIFVNACKHLQQLCEFDFPRSPETCRISM